MIKIETTSSTTQVMIRLLSFLPLESYRRRWLVVGSHPLTVDCTLYLCVQAFCHKNVHKGHSWTLCKGQVQDP